MDKFKNNKDLISGKGEQDIEWITANGTHIPIKEGENKQEAVNQFFEDKEKQDAIQSLVNTLKNVKNIKFKELREYIIKLNPIKLAINADEIFAQFDKFTAKKNLFDKASSDDEGFQYKINNIKNLPNIIKNSTYTFSSKEQGKSNKAHKGVKQWHYFTKQIDADNEKYNVVVNIRDKGEEQFVYEVQIRKKKT